MSGRFRNYFSLIMLGCIPVSSFRHNDRGSFRFLVRSCNKVSIDKRHELSAVQGVGEDGCSLPSPSMVNTYSKPVQATVFVSIMASLIISTAFSIDLIDRLKFSNALLSWWMGSWWLLGPIYVAAGVTHFTLQKDYCNIMPAKGAWGLWFLPGSNTFHVGWTGIVEIVGGLWLTLGGLANIFGETIPIQESDGAAILALITFLVTPANIYMYTHGAKLPMNGTETPVSGHAIRGLLQIVLLTFLVEQAEPTFANIFH